MRTGILIWLLLMPMLANISCQSHRAKEAEEIRSQFLQDSIREVHATDSLRRNALKDRIDGYRALLDELPIENSDTESYRVFVEFSWGKSPVGSLLAVHVSKNNGLHQIVIKSLPVSAREGRLRAQKQISEAEFQKIAGMFDEVDFERQPIVEKVDYKVYDASQYVVEQSEAAQYHAISRSDSVDKFVFQILVAVLHTASYNNPELMNEFERFANQK
jgi:hypothetical protein